MISSIPSSSVNLLATYEPLGRQPVGQENSDLKSSSMKALEQSAASARGENRRSAGDNPGDQQKVVSKQDSGSQDQRQARTKAVQQEQLVKDQVRISELSARDRDVRAHEQAHAAVGGQYAGSPTYEFVKGPDGVNYAVGGEVSISMGGVLNDPEATIRKAQQIRAAADAPADPSGQDRSVAAAAAALETQARAELAAKQNAEIQNAERKAAGDSNTQKLEDAKNVEREARLRKEDDEKLAKEEARQALLIEENRRTQARAEGINTFSQVNSKTLNINRHLVEIGVISGISSRGSFLNKQV